MIILSPIFYIAGGDALLVVEDTENRVTLNQLLMFVTGADGVPPLGFPGEPTLNFLHTGTVFPEANTCALILKLPLHTTFESFSDSMISGIIQSSPPVLGMLNLSQHFFFFARSC